MDDNVAAVFNEVDDLLAGMEASLRAKRTSRRDDFKDLLENIDKLEIQVEV